MKQNSSYQKNSNYYKSAYEQICVDEAVKSNLRRLEMRKQKKLYSHMIRTAVAAVAAICLLFTGLVNGSTAFAAKAENIPVIGKLAEFVHFRSYAEETQDYAINVSIPAIENNGTNTDLSDDVNAEIQKLCEQYAADAKERAIEYREAFLETGGTEEEWEEHHITISVDYELKSQNSDYLSFVIYGYESWLSSTAVAYYYNLNVHTMQYVTLEELFGTDYINYVNREIKQQIKERQKNGSDTFFTPKEGGFTSISEKQNYYINDAGNIVIVFDKYTIAPGFMGDVEFEIEAP